MQKMAPKYSLQKVKQSTLSRKAILPKCPHCKTGNLRNILVFDKRGPPFYYMGDSQTSIPYKS
jgi:hypothetical protein